MPFLLAFAQIISYAQVLIPVIANLHKAQNPEASNAALENTQKVLGFAQTIVGTVEAATANQTNEDGSKLSGAQKLAIAQTTVQAGHDAVIAAGGTSDTFDAFWNPLNAAITAICAADKTVKQNPFLAGQSKGGHVA